MSSGKVLVFIPTYNEADNAEKIYQQIKALKLNADILFLDDNSPDGTGKIIDKLTTEDSSTFAIHRQKKSGIGSAHQTGIQWAYENGYGTLITMDCDFTHSPFRIIDFINSSNDATIVVGSRYMQTDSLSTWNLFRKSLTHLGHFLTVNLLKMPYDASGAFRLYDLNKIDRSLFKLVQSNGYSFFFESLFILHYNNIKVTEIAIDLPARTYGTSKMSWKDAWHSLRFLFDLYKRKTFNKTTLKVK